MVKFNKKGTSTHLKGIQHHQQNRQESRTCHEWIAATPEETMVNVGTVVDHTFTETNALRKTRSANPAETKPFCSCLQKKFTWVSKTRHIWRHSWKWRICVYTIGGDKQPNCKVKKTDGNDGQLRRIGRSHGRTLRELYKRKVPRATKRRIFSYGSSTLLPILATIEAEIFANSNSTWTTLHVINDIQETSWSWVQHCYKTCACSRSSTKSNLTRPVPSPPST